MAILNRPVLNVSAARLPWGIHYGWVIVAVLAVVQTFGSSIFMIAGIMVQPLNDPDGNFGWGLGTVGGAVALYYLCSAIFAPISGHLGDRLGARRMMLAGLILYAVGMSLMGFITQVWQLFLFYSVVMSLTASMN